MSRGVALGNSRTERYPIAAFVPLDQYSIGNVEGKSCFHKEIKKLFFEQEKIGTAPIIIDRLSRCI